MSQSKPTTDPAAGPFAQLLQKHAPSNWRKIGWVSILIMLCAAGWASQAKLERVASASGVVAPKGQVRVAQHPEGGVVETIHVRIGDMVRHGEPLLDLKLSPDGLSVTEIDVRLDALRLERARVLAESQRIDLVLPADEAARRPDLAAAEKAAYRSRRRDHESSLAMLREQKRQKELEVASLEQRQAATKAKLQPLQVQLDLTQKLINKRLRTRTEGLELERELKEIESEITGLTAALPLAEKALAEARERELFERNRFRKAAAERLREIEIDIARESERRARAELRADTAVVSSPIDGVIKSLNVTNIGAVVGPRQPIAEIVPSGEALVIEAKLSPLDIGHISVGQPAVVKLSTYDYLRYGTLEGEVAQISADAYVDDNGKPFFQLIIATEMDALEVDGERFRISPGMEATIDLRLGYQNVAQYILGPVLKLKNEAFRDR